MQRNLSLRIKKRKTCVRKLYQKWLQIMKFVKTENYSSEKYEVYIQFKRH